jgi:hypothetical protein
MDGANDEGENTFAVLVSPYIGCKVFLNFISAFVRSPPTKNMIFFYNPEETLEENKIVEIKTKGTSTKRLIDYGIKNGSIIALKQTFESIPESDFKTLNDVAKVFGVKLSN